MNKLQNLLPAIQTKKTHQTRLYLVTRIVKPGIASSSRIPDKYQYECYTINTNADIQKELFEIFTAKIGLITNEDKFSLDEYSVITDDAENKILTYTKKEKIASFIHIVDTDLRNSSELNAVKNLVDIADNLWAYIIEVTIGNKLICGMRKMSPSKVLLAENGKGFAAQFRINEQSLVLSKDQSIIFDKSLDALYVDNTFFVIQKNNFEEIVGLEAEYREEARQVADKIFHCPQISIKNFDLLNEIENKNRFIRKLTKIKDEIDNLDSKRVKKMKETASLFKLNFLLDKSGKIIINDEKALDVVIKLLDDYYLKSQQTGKRYGASAKKEFTI
jgi:hypothetical protein